MPRHCRLALGLAALAVGLALGAAPSPAAAPPAAAPQAAAPGTAHDESTLERAEEEFVRAENKIAAHETADGEPNILEPQPNLALWTVVVFGGLLGVLYVFAWKPLLAAMHNREEHLEHVLLETERARNESEQLLAEHRRRLAASEEQVRALIEEARRNATAAADEIIRKAQAEAEAARQRAERDIETARDEALSEIWSRTADLAVSVAGRVLNKSLSEDDHRRLIDAAVGELPAVRPAAGGGHAA
jgi:F-type H+-transporting ATPase subunit b